MELIKTSKKYEFILTINNIKYDVDYYDTDDRYSGCNYITKDYIEYDDIKSLRGKELIKNLSMDVHNNDYSLTNNLLWFNIANNHKKLIFKFHFDIEWHRWSEKINLKEYIHLLVYKLDNEHNIIDVGDYIEEGRQYVAFSIEYDLDNIIDEYYNEILSLFSKLHNEIIDMHNEEKTEPTIIRSIEFEPEYYQAGLGILNYFGTVVREKYPEGNAKVKIEQNGYSVTMTIETEDGEKETIEKLLQNYELVVIGEKAPDTLFDSKLQIIDLKHELGIAKVRIETQKELILCKHEEVKNLTSLFKHKLNNSSVINMELSPNINIDMKQSTELFITKDISEISSNLEKVINNCNDNMIKTYLSDVNNEVHKISNEEDKNKVKESSALTKIKGLVEDANKTGSSLNTFLNNVSNGVNTIKQIGKKYNSIAEWCGAPQVPSQLLK